MFSLGPITRFTAAPAAYLTALTDLFWVERGGRSVLYSVTRAGGGVLALDVTGGGFEVLSQHALPLGSGLSAPTRLAITTYNGQDALWVTGVGGVGISGISLHADGALQSSWSRATSGQNYPFSAHVELAAQGLIYTAETTTSVITGWRMTAGLEALQPVSQLTLGTAFQGVTIAVMTAFERHGRSYIALLDAAQSRLVVAGVDSQGALTIESALGAAQGVGMNAPSSLQLFSAHGASFALIGSTNASAITLMRVSDTGALTLADHVIDTADTRFARLMEVRAITIAGRAFVVAAGTDDGLSVLEVLPNGRLVLIGSHVFAGALSGAVAQIELAPKAGGFDVFLGTEAQGIYRFSVALPPLGAVVRAGETGGTLQGGAAADMVLGGRGDDTLFGGAGDDILLDGAGVDRLTGGAGADLFVLSADGQADTITDFQLGVDRLDLSAWGAVYSVASLTVQPTAQGATLRFRSEVLHLLTADGRSLSASDLAAAGIGALYHADVAMTDARGRYIGTERDDLLIGSGGPDLFVVGEGRDTIIGGGGVDTIDMSALAAGVKIDLAAGLVLDGPTLGQEYRQIDAVIGTGWNDWVNGTARANLFYGEAGQDALIGRGGADTLYGGLGDDTLWGGDGADLLDGGAGQDWATYRDSPLGVSVDVMFPTSNSGFARGDRFVSVENLMGSLYGDALYGDRLNNVLDGLDGNDTLYGRAGADLLYGGAGDDWFFGGPGADTLVGGAGRDTVSYADITFGITVNMLNPLASTSAAYGDVFRGIEAVVGTSFDDKLLGTAAAEALYGGGGNDWLYGRGGGDSLYGGLGHDHLYGGGLASLFDGGAGMDRVYYSNSAGLLADLLTPARNRGEAAQDRYVNVEGLVGGSAGDALFGDHSANILEGGLGGDTLFGRGGADTLYGGAGDDTLNGGPGADFIYGGPGVDTVIHWDAPAGVRVDLAQPARNTGVAAGDVHVGIENLWGSTHNDDLYGNWLANRLDGDAGDDRLEGRGGSDRLYGGAGRDTLFGGGGDDLLYGGLGADVFGFDQGADRIMDFQPHIDRIRLDARFAGVSLAQVARFEAGGWLLDFGTASLRVEGAVSKDALFAAIYWA